MKRKSHIILDLDQTLISSTKKKNPNFKSYNLIDEDGKLVYVIHERPYLQEFLDFLFKNYRVSVWTLASLGYAVFVIEKILLKKRKRKLELFYFDYHCDISKSKSGVSKNIKYLDPNATIIDDNKEVQSGNKKEGNKVISAPPFFCYGGRKAVDDTFLLDLKNKLKKGYYT